MPELPEVETVRRGLVDVVGCRIVAGWGHPTPKFATAVEAVGCRIQDLSRQGKFLIFQLGPLDLVIHLGMTGQLRIRPESEPPDPYCRAWWSLQRGRRSVGRLELRDVRRFGRAVVVPAGDYHTIGALFNIGPDPLTSSVDGSILHERLSRRHGPIKASLLDQHVIAGIGNIYADESLFAAGIAPKTPSNTLSVATLDRLALTIAAAIDEGLAHGGTSLRDYVQADGSQGEHQDHLAVYGRYGQPCVRCGTTLSRTEVAGRTTTWCTSCQPM